MINPIKRAVIILCICAIMFLTTLFVPAVQHSHYLHFLQGGVVGGSLVAVLMLVFASYIRESSAR
jgi:inner membrane protein involved in colicin E2 resistance